MLVDFFFIVQCLKIVFFASSGFFRLKIVSDNKVVGIMMVVLGILWSLVCAGTIVLTVIVRNRREFDQFDLFIVLDSPTLQTIGC